MEELKCPNCSGVVEVPPGESFGKCKYCRRTFNVSNAEDMAKASAGDTENVVKWRKELSSNLDIQDRSQKKRDYSAVKHFALQILSVLPGDFTSKYFVAMSDYKAGNDAPYLDFLKNADLSRASTEEREFISDKIIEYIEKKHEKAAKEYFARAYGENSSAYEKRVDKAIATYIEHVRLAGVRDCDVFICHSSVDADDALTLCDILEKGGLTCWISERNLLPGTPNYEEELNAALGGCRMLLVLSTANSIYSKECEKEVRIANAEGKLFFVVKTDNESYFGTFKKVLSSVQWLNAMDGIAGHADEIVASVKMVFADDEEERAEMARRALEAKRNAAEKTSARTAAPTVTTATPVTATTDAYLTQLNTLFSSNSITEELLRQAQFIIDTGLGVNPQSVDLWYWKFAMDAYKQYYVDGRKYDIINIKYELINRADAKVNEVVRPFLENIQKVSSLEFPASSLIDAEMLPYSADLRAAYHSATEKIKSIQANYDSRRVKTKSRYEISSNDAPAVRDSKKAACAQELNAIDRDEAVELEPIKQELIKAETEIKKAASGFINYREKDVKALINAEKSFVMGFAFKNVADKVRSFLVDMSLKQRVYIEGADNLIKNIWAVSPSVYDNVYFDRARSCADEETLKILDGIKQHAKTVYDKYCDRIANEAESQLISGVKQRITDDIDAKRKAVGVSGEYFIKGNPYSLSLDKLEKYKRNIGRRLLWLPLSLALATLVVVLSLVLGRAGLVDMGIAWLFIIVAVVTLAVLTAKSGVFWKKYRKSDVEVLNAHLEVFKKADEQLKTVAEFAKESFDNKQRH